MPAANQGEAERRPPRWLAILLSALTLPLPAMGLLILRRSKRDWLWPAAGVLLVVAYCLAGATAPALVVPAAVAILALWVAGIVVTCLARAGEFRGWGPTLAIVVAVVAVNQGIARGSRLVGLETFTIPGGSTLPTLLGGDRIAVTKIDRLPSRGDMIVFKYPLAPDTDYVKRVIALPGETISIKRNQVFIDDKPLPRRPVDRSCAALLEGRPCQLWEEQAGTHKYNIIHEAREPTDFGPKKLGPGEYFVMGDNRDNSNDSRVWGTVPANLVRGRATTITFSSTPESGVRWERMGRVIE
jgi:signal peptidase I